jgi:hypothetical protein
MCCLVPVKKIGANFKLGPFHLLNHTLHQQARLRWLTIVPMRNHCSELFVVAYLVRRATILKQCRHHRPEGTSQVPPYAKTHVSPVHIRVCH